MEGRYGGFRKEVKQMALMTELFACGKGSIYP